MVKFAGVNVVIEEIDCLVAPWGQGIQTRVIPFDRRVCLHTPHGRWKRKWRQGEVVVVKFARVNVDIGGRRRVPATYY